tara:strand:+ start:2227 stop:2667 length:441 start_codon:yes stop_codon:yes gene_type:complete
VASNTYKATFDNMLSVGANSEPLELKTHNMIRGFPSYGNRQAMYPSTTSSPDGIAVLDNGQFKPLMHILNTSNSSNASLNIEIKMGDGNYYDLYNYIQCIPNGFLSIINDEIPIYINGDDVEFYSQRGGGGTLGWLASHAEYHKNA